jgi:oxygen-independent coproporphyrinogen III oxidase
MESRAPAWGLYVHVPWCRVRCPYCAFNVRPDREADWASLEEGLARDAALWLPSFHGRPGSVYFGGGTPSLLPLDRLEALLALLPAAEEITLEANPGTLDSATLVHWKELGITRLSLGIQTFDRRFAHLLNRGHSVDESEALLAMVRDVGFASWSLDLMFGLPGQGVDDLARDLDRVLAHRPPHVSLYGLTVEPGTPWEGAVRRGRLVPVDDETWRAMYDLVVERLEEGGWERYEVSNFALAHHRSRHNEAIWRGGAYAGLGPGAHGFLPTGERTVMTLDPARWARDPILERALPTPLEAAHDRVLTQIRHVDGLDVEALAQATGYSPSADMVRRLQEHGLLERQGTSLALTREGFALADGVTRQLAGALEKGPGLDRTRPA